MRIIAIIAARIGSTRLPGKVLFPVTDEWNQAVLWHVIHAANRAIGVDDVVVATTGEKRDDDIVELCRIRGIPCWRGSENNVLERFYDAAKHYHADAVVRLTGDCPLLDAYVISEVVALFRRTGVAYANNTEPATYPDGLDVEVVSMQALSAAHKEATLPSDRDTVCQWVSRNQTRFKAATLICPIPGLEIERWVLDTEEDYEFVQEIFKRLNGHMPSLPRILDILRCEPYLRGINAKWKRNERFLEQVGKAAGA